jgi:ATP-binding protein involved in chromosome partitioning
MPVRLDGVAHTILVASGKGGVGKTTVAVNLALALARDGARVGIFDADLYGPNVPLMLGIRRRSSSQGMVPIARAQHRSYIAPLERFGLRVMSMGFVVADRDALNPDPRFVNRLVVQTLRDVAWGGLDYLLIDTPPGTGEPQHTLVREVAIDAAVVVTTPSGLALLDAGRSVAAFRRDGVPIAGVIENMAYLVCPHCGEDVALHDQTADSGAALDCPVLARVPTGPEIGRIVGSRHPLLAGEAVEPGATAFIEAAVALRDFLAQNHKTNAG